MGALTACIGAFAQHTTVRRDRIETRIVKWFEDQFELAQEALPTGRNALLQDIAG